MVYKPKNKVINVRVTAECYDLLTDLVDAKNKGKKYGKTKISDEVRKAIDNYIATEHV